MLNNSCVKTHERMRSTWLTGAGVLGLVGAALLSTPALAQLTPDNTLGVEQTRVTPVDGLNDRINGGAARGINLFHSFRDFNVDAGRSVYFANPDGIVNILSRVTGGNPSNIFGRLGVLGSANLFLLNPNGIIFGENASLDIAGSFVATTAEAIALGEQGYFSATQPQQSQLLSIEPGALFFNQLPDPRGRIQNTGSLAVGQDLTLAADTLDLQGQLQAGRNLTLQGQDTVRIRDSATRPFVAAAGGQLLVQGNQLVDIFALNHPNSGLFSGGDMTLRSANTVGGDAHYWSYGNFRVETLDGSLGSLYSPYDPVIRSAGDVIFDFYQGASLHIFAGGQVLIPSYIWIQGPDLQNGLPAQTVTLENGSTVEIDGQTRPTLDIRAGTIDFGTPGVVGDDSGIGFFSGIPVPSTASPTSADIQVGTILFVAPGFNFTTGTGTPLAGTILLTNQYQPNSSLSGNISVNRTQSVAYLNGRAIVNGTFDTGGLIELHSKGEITIDGIVNADPAPFALGGTALILGNGGDVRMRAAGNITLTPRSLIYSTGVLGGSITLDSGGTISASNGGGIYSYSVGPAPNDLRGGDITITAAQSLLLDNASITTSTIPLAQLRPEAPLQTTAVANPGNIVIRVGDLVRLTNQSQVRGLVESGGIGQGGVIDIRGRSLEVRDGSQIGGALFRELRDDAGNLRFPGGIGSGGDIYISVSDSVLLSGIDQFGFSSGLIALTERGANGPAGNITVVAGGNLRVEQGAAIAAATRNSGDGGIIDITAGTIDLLSGGRILAISDGGGDAEAVTITALDRLTIDGVDENYAARLVTINAYLQTPIGQSDTLEDVLGGVNAPYSGVYGNIQGTGQANTVTLNANTIMISNAGVVTSDTSGTQAGGDIIFNSNSLLLLDGGSVTSRTFSSGSAGSITVNSTASVILSGVADFPYLADGSTPGGFSSGFAVNAEDGSTGSGGTLTVNTDALQIHQGAVLSARTRGSGRGGDVIANVNTLDVTGGGQILTTTFSSGPAGGIFIRALGDINISGADPTFDERRANVAQTFGADAAAFIIDPVSNRSGLQAQSSPNSTGSGNVVVSSRSGSISVRDTAEVSTSTAGLGNAGFVGLFAANGSVTFDNAIVFSQVDPGSPASGGTVFIGASSVALNNGSQLQTQTSGDGSSFGRVSAAGNVIIQTNGGDISLDNSAIFSSVEPGGFGQGGNIQIFTGSLSMNNGAELQTQLSSSRGGQAGGRGTAGVIFVDATNSVSLTGNSSIFSFIGDGADGSIGNNAFAGGLFDALLNPTSTQQITGSIFITTGELSISDSSQLNTGTYGTGNAGAIAVVARGDVSLTNSSGLLSTVGLSANGNAGGIVMLVDSLSAGGGSGLTTSTFGQGDAGLILVLANQNITLTGEDSGIFSGATEDSSFAAGGIGIQADQLFIERGAQISVNNRGTGNLRAGDIFIQADSIFLDRQGEIVAKTNSGDGGNINLEVSRLILLRRNSQIRTDAGEPIGGGTGGIITISRPFIIAVPSRDSNITAQAYNGDGGFVQVESRGLFGIDFRDEDYRNTNDITASSRNPSFVDGTVVVNSPDTSFIQDSLSDFSQTLIDTNQLLSNSCIVRSRQQQGSFVVTGTSGLPVRPGDAGISNYPTGTVRSPSTPGTEKPGRRSWKPGDPIVEPQGVYQLPDGRLVLSRECP